MVREIITLNVGECGINLASTIWEQYNLEHGIDPSGVTSTNDGDITFHTFYEETATAKFAPRNLMIDSEPEAINAVKASKYGNLFQPEHLLSSKDGACGCFARGYNTVGKELMDKVVLKILAKIFLINLLNKKSKPINSVVL